jgi:D-alanine-D-alanine ligase
VKIAILHDQVPPDARPDEADTLAQACVVEASLRRLGHEVALVPFSLDLEGVRRSLGLVAPDLVFNLVEAPGGSGCLIHLAPSLLESMRLPYSGAPADAVYLTSNKILAKRLLHQAGIATPGWVESSGGGSPGWSSGCKFIVKSVWEHASIGLDDDSIVEAASPSALVDIIASRAARLGGEAFAEQFIAGREFNLSLLMGQDGPEVLPPAEIQFVGYGPDRPRIVGYKAKWNKGSFEFTNTPRTFDFPSADEGLLTELRRIALSCWRLFRLRGHARVDFRVDESSGPWVLEVNTNPCLSPDAGFAAAVERSGIGFDTAIARIVADIGPPMAARPSAGLSRVVPGPFRTSVHPADAGAVRDIVTSSGFFSAAEIDVAVELVEEHLSKGETSGYLFLFAEEDGRTIGYACYGPIACTTASYDLYWIAVHADHRGHGLGRRLAAEVERLIAARGGARVYAETSSRPQYQPTRAFYERCGYARDAEMEDFYAPGDGKVVYVRVLDRPVSG